MSEEFRSNDDLLKLNVKIELLTTLLMVLNICSSATGSLGLEHKLKQFTIACECQSGDYSDEQMCST